ncbi:HD domain-containing protein, partial [Aduncisulcus paluster]
MLDLRFISGRDELFRHLSEEFRAKVIPAAGDEFCRILWGNRSKTGKGMDSVVLEPDLKMAGEPCAMFSSYVALLMQARSAVHFLRKRKQDKLILEILPDAASLCGVKGYDPAKRGNDLLTSIHKAMVRVRSMGDALYRESFDADS